MRKRLLIEFMAEAPFQPATNYWRAVEIDEVIRHGLPVGLGLDLGCGDGHLMGIILKRVGPRDLVGLDVDPKETEAASGRNVYKRVVTGAADELPFPSDHFDFVFSNSVLEHIDRINETLKEIARVLRPGGRFLFTVPGENFRECLRGPLIFGNRDAYLREIDARCAHLRYWNSNEWAEALRCCGLVQVHNHEYLTLGEVRRWELIARNTSGILYRLSGRKKQPIEIQRELHVRNRIRLPRFVAILSAFLMNLGNPTDKSSFGGLLVEAEKAV